MPNHVTNILEFDCSMERSREIMEFVKLDGQGYGTFDFNKLIPMPEALNITAGSETDHSIEIYLTAVNPSTKDYGYPKLPVAEFASLRQTLNSERTFTKFSDRLSESEIRQYTLYDPFESFYQTGKTAADNIRQYGATTWYDWCIQNWGSKWNAYDCVDMDPADGYMTFLTAWDSVPQIVQKLSEKFPDVTVHYSWADEDMGFNTGKLDFKGGKVIGRDIPEGGTYHAYEIACEVQGYDIDEFDIQPETPHKNKDRDAR